MTTEQSTTLTELEDAARHHGRTLDTTFDGCDVLVSGLTPGVLIIFPDGGLARLNADW